MGPLGAAAWGPAGAAWPGIAPPVNIISNCLVSAFWLLIVEAIFCWRKQYWVHVNSSKP